MHTVLSAVTVRFGAVTAVDAVSLSIAAGEIHAIVGENGAGKTTLMNAMFGLVQPEAGRLDINGEVIPWGTSAQAIRRGFGMVHQHFMLQDSMSVLENILLCDEPTYMLGFVDFRAAREELAMRAGNHGIDVDLDAKVGSLSVGERQVVEILKVLYREARVLILDEPTAVLTPLEKDRLFAVLKSFRTEGRAIVLITHKLDEVMELADKVSVMRGGRLISSKRLTEISKEEIAQDIVGGDLPPPRKRRKQNPGDEVLSVHDLRFAGQKSSTPITFSVRGGEIVGIAGVSGNGQAELVQSLTGLSQVRSGAITLCGISVETLDIAARRRIGLGYIPEDRQRVGLALDATVSENANAVRSDHAAFTRGPFLDRAAMAAFARELVERFRIKVESVLASAATMSGGNRQKLVVGRELTRATPLIIAENPTWGVDIGATDFIHGELIRRRDEGHAILLVSNDLDEIMALSDRVLVMFEGRVAGELAGDAITPVNLGQLMTSRAMSPISEIA